MLTKKLQLVGPPIRALPLDPARGFASPRPYAMSPNHRDRSTLMLLPVIFLRSWGGRYHTMSFAIFYPESLSSSDDIAIGYVLPASWVTSYMCLAIIVEDKAMPLGRILKGTHQDNRGPSLMSTIASFF